MLFKKKGFFLELGDGSEPSAPAATVAPVREATEDDQEIKTEPEAKPAQVAVAVAAPVETVKETPTPATPAPSEAKKPSLTTAEAIAAELAAAESARPEVTLTTFAVDALQPGNALRPQKRRPGANLSGFRSMASELFKSSSTGRETSL